MVDNNVLLRWAEAVSKEDLGIPDEKLNPFGGAIALGHPFGMTGARIMTTLLNGLSAMDGTYGIESMCVAGRLDALWITATFFEAGWEG